MKRSMLVCVMILCLMPCALADGTVFAPQGEYLVFFEEGLYGVQRLDGRTVIPARFSGVCPMQGDLCVVENSDGVNLTYGLWRLSTGEELLPCEYGEMEIAGSMVLTSGILDQESDISYFCQLYDPEKRAFAVTEDESPNGIWPIADGQFYELFNLEDDTITRLVDHDGSNLLNMPLLEAEAWPSSNGIIEVYGLKGEPGWEWENGTRYYNTVTGTWLDDTWKSGYAFADGYAAVWGEDWKWYVIDETGTVVTPAYEWIANEHDTAQYGYGLFPVKRTDGWYIIQVSSEAGATDLLGPISCSGDPNYLGGGVFAFPTEEGMLVYAGLTGQRRLLPGSRIFRDSESCRSLTVHNEKYGFLFTDLTMIEPVYDGCVDFLGDYGFVKIDSLWYPIDRTGQVDRSVSYPNVRISYSFEENCYLVEYDEHDIMCLNPDLQPITHLSEAYHG